MTTLQENDIGSSIPAFRMPATPPEVLSRRAATIHRVRRVVRERFGKEYTVECFGSTMYGVDTPNSDLDLVIIDPHLQTGFPPEVLMENLPRIYNIRQLAKSLRDARFLVIQTIPKALVPIVKFEDRQNGIHCDINVNNQLGLFNTKLIKRYCDVAPVLRPLVFLVKTWAKANGMNEPSRHLGPTTFSSYSLTLMTIGFLQMKGLLPNLQAEIEPPSLDEEDDRRIFWVRVGKNSRPERCDYTFHNFDNWSPPELVTSEPEELLKDWLQFWGHTFKYDAELMSIRDGGIFPRVQRPKKKKRPAKGERKGKGKEVADNAAEDKGIVDSAADDHEPDTANYTGAGAIETLTAAVGEKLVLNTNGGTAPSSNDMEARDETPDMVDVADGVADAAAGGAHEAEVDEGDDEEPEEISLANGREPKHWVNHNIIIADPFIRSKNATSAISPASLKLFVTLCQRSVALLQDGHTIGEITTNLMTQEEREKTVGGGRRPRNAQNRGRDRPARASPERPRTGAAHLAAKANHSLTRPEMAMNSVQSIMDISPDEPRWRVAATASSSNNSRNRGNPRPPRNQVGGNSTARPTTNNADGVRTEAATQRPRPASRHFRIPAPSRRLIGSGVLASDPHPDVAPP